jgi:hypothetical protein
VPFFFKHVVDALAALPAAGAAPPELLATSAALPVAAVAAYGAARVAASALSELRTALFADVTQNAIRNISLRTFQHVHALDLSFHLSRQTGTISRTMERGTRGINFSLSALLFNVVPTVCFAPPHPRAAGSGQTAR